MKIQSAYPSHNFSGQNQLINFTTNVALPGSKHQTIKYFFLHLYYWSIWSGSPWPFFLGGGGHEC